MFASPCTRWPRPDGIKAALVVTSGFGCCKRLLQPQVAFAATSDFSAASDFCNRKWLWLLQVALAATSGFCSHKWLLQLQVALTATSGFCNRNRLLQPQAAPDAASEFGRTQAARHLLTFGRLPAIPGSFNCPKRLRPPNRTAADNQSHCDIII